MEKQKELRIKDNKEDDMFFMLLNKLRMSTLNFIRMNKFIFKRMFLVNDK